jgi:hypothetical protein
MPYPLLFEVPPRVDVGRVFPVQPEHAIALLPWEPLGYDVHSLGGVVGQGNAGRGTLEELGKDLLDSGSCFHELGEELVNPVEGMVPVVAVEGLKDTDGGGGYAGVVQICAMLVNREQLANLIPHQHPAAKRFVAAASRAFFHGAPSTKAHDTTFCRIPRLEERGLSWDVNAYA